MPASKRKRIMNNSNLYLRKVGGKPYSNTKSAKEKKIIKIRGEKMKYSTV